MKTRPVRLLIVDDEAGFRETMKERFEHRGFEVSTAADAEVGLNLLAVQPFQLALLDMRMPGMDGLTLLRQAKDRWPFLEVIVITGQGSIDSAVEAMRRGAASYLTKPVRTAELDVAIDRALQHAELARDRQVKAEALQRKSPPDDFVHRSSAMKALEETAARVAASDATILIEGETGTGKEVLASFIHRRSGRRDDPFVVLDCGTLADQLLERELFGHERGAYTGADQARPGLVAVSEGGSLVIDEIGHTSAGVQAKLLRLIERGTYRRLGDPTEVRADVRILAATNQNLEALSKKGDFREDLFHRLNVFRLRIPPLREHREDIRPLASFFLSRHSPVKSQPKSLSSEAQAALLSYDWPGNIRELGNVIQRACLIAEGSEIEIADLGLDVEKLSPEGQLSLRAAERRHIEIVLASAKGDKPSAAKQLGITVRHLYRKLNKHGLHGA